jgi:release factor glutamine methyltransferase
MILREALDDAATRLEMEAVGSARMNAEVLLMFTLACDRAYLFAHPERELTLQEVDRYEQALAERARGVPAQYIVGHQEFWGLDLLVGPAVLIPRPETEHVIETVLSLVRDAVPPVNGAPERNLQIGKQGGSGRNLQIVDIGTGSGCIALALASELEEAEIWATDISAAALEMARANAARLQLSGRVRFRQGDLLAGMDQSQPRFDFVVSNPPYVGEDEADKVQREVRKFEPQEAVFAGPNGLDVIARLIPQARQALKPGGWLVMEIGYTQEKAVRALLVEWPEVCVVPDLQGIPRVVAARQ